MRTSFIYMNKLITACTICTVLQVLPNLQYVVADSRKCNHSNYDKKGMVLPMPPQLRSKVDPTFAEDERNFKELHHGNSSKNEYNLSNDQRIAAAVPDTLLVKGEKLKSYLNISEMSKANEDESKSRNKRMKPILEENTNNIGKRKLNSEEKLLTAKKEIKKVENYKKSDGLFSRIKDKISGKKKDQVPLAYYKREFPRSIREINRDEDMLQNLLINRLSLNEAGTVPPTLIIVRSKNNEDPVLMTSRRVRRLVLKKPKERFPILEYNNLV